MCSSDLVHDMAARSQDIARLGNQAGEGWYLTAEMVDMIEHGCPNIICAYLRDNMQAMQEDVKIYESTVNIDPLIIR